VSFEKVSARFDDEVLRITDPDGLLLELVTAEDLNENINLPDNAPVPSDFAIRGFHAPTLELQRAGLTTQLLTEIFGFELLKEAGNRHRFALDPRLPNKQVDLVERSDTGFGHIAVGTVHHIAFRAASNEEQVQWREKLAELGFGVTPVIDRQYFHSIYFREPGGILFEIATDAPGFAVDEPIEKLGESLKLPPQYEEHRSEIERTLPTLSFSPRSRPTTEVIESRNR
jgi:glyoxalase family protein